MRERRKDSKERRLKKMRGGDKRKRDRGRKEGGRERDCVWEGRGEERGLHMKVIFETNILFFTAQSVYFLVKFNVWVHLATVDSLNPEQPENRKWKSVTQNRPSENIFHWRYSGNQKR